MQTQQQVENLRLDWEVVREIVAAEDGLPIEIAVPVEEAVAIGGPGAEG